MQAVFASYFSYFFHSIDMDLATLHNPLDHSSISTPFNRGFFGLDFCLKTEPDDLNSYFNNLKNLNRLQCRPKPMNDAFKGKKYYISEEICNK